MTKFAASAKTAITALKYTTDLESDAVIIFTVSGGADRWWAQIKLCYRDDEYRYEYVDSYDLGANPARNRIHDNYTRLITERDNVTPSSVRSKLPVCLRSTA